MCSSMILHLELLTCHLSSDWLAVWWSHCFIMSLWPFTDWLGNQHVRLNQQSNVKHFLNFEECLDYSNNTSIMLLQIHFYCVIIIITQRSLVACFVQTAICSWRITSWLLHYWNRIEWERIMVFCLSLSLYYCLYLSQSTVSIFHGQIAELTQPECRKKENSICWLSFKRITKEKIQKMNQNLSKTSF